MSLPQRLFTAWHQLMEMVDSRTVRLFQVIVYSLAVVAGLYAALFSEPLSVVDVAMGTTTYAVWVGMNIACPALVAFGCWLARDKGEYRLKRGVTNGFLFQLAGNVGMVFTFGAYVSAMWHSAWWGKGTYSLFLAAALTLCATLLVFGDLRRLFVHSERA